MLLARLRAIAVLCCVAVITGYGWQSPGSNSSWPPPLQSVGKDSPVLAPADAMKTFFMPPGFRLELVAAEPLVQDPVAIDWDPAGRLWVVEMPGFVRDLSLPEPNLDPIGRVVVLEDTDRDGAMDKRTVFADGLALARSLKVLEHGVLVAEPPNAWLMKDTDGDLRMDARELVTDSYGRRDAAPEQNANEFYWALDNAMHTAMGDVYLRLKHGRFEVLPTLPKGEWGVTQDDGGRIYRNTNESAIHADLVPTPYFARHPHLVRTRGSYEALTAPGGDVNEVWPVRPNPGTNRAYQLGIDRPDGTLARFTSVCAPVVYRGDRLPRELYGNVFVAEPAANLVSRILLEDDGRTLRARKAYERGEFLASTDERFRPVYLSNAPDGTLYVVDMYRGVIQQRRDITEYLRDYITTRGLEKPIGLGRIYRVVHESTVRDTAAAAAGRLDAATLVERLSHPNGWWRDAAQRMLVERDGKGVAPALAKLAAAAPDWRTRLHALWTLDGIDALDAELVVRALDDPSRDVRASAVRLAERLLGDEAHRVQPVFARRLKDEDWFVRHQAAASVGSLPPALRDSAAVTVAEAYGDDPTTLDALLSGLRGAELRVLEELSRRGGEGTPAKDAAVVMLSATIIRSGEGSPVQAVFSTVADEGRPGWLRNALLRGAEIALLGAPIPGTPARTAAQLPPPPCPTCPGARGGPGGAYAFRDPATLPAARGRGAARTLRLGNEPVRLTELARSPGDLGTRAARLLARVEWPGKPGVAAAAPPLTEAEMQRFNAGREIYRNVCQACHQADGRGMEKLAPSLIESPFAVGPAEVPIRVVLHGKEGRTGMMMPPVGQTFSDEQLAAVLTYVRREWGQTAAPVDPATVARVRAATAERARPWTEGELLQLMK